MLSGLMYHVVFPSLWPICVIFTAQLSIWPSSLTTQWDVVCSWLNHLCCWWHFTDLCRSASLEKKRRKVLEQFPFIGFTPPLCAQSVKLKPSASPKQTMSHSNLNFWLFPTRFLCIIHFQNSVYDKIRWRLHLISILTQYSLCGFCVYSALEEIPLRFLIDYSH